MTEKKKDEKKEFLTVADVLHHVQMTLHAPKNQVNTFGKYKYRSCEDILEGLKKVLPTGAYVTIEDDIQEIGGRIYVKASAKLVFKGAEIVNTAFAREAESKKGMDESQVTGATSSYARKYALNGLFLIDDVKDADAQAAPEKEQKKITDAQAATMKKELEETGSDVTAFLKHLGAESVDDMTEAQVNRGKVLLDKKRKAIENAGA